MLPLLKSLADGEEHKFSELVTQLGSQLNLTEDELSKLLPSGTRSRRDTHESRLAGVMK